MWTFLVCDVKQPIIGADFVKTHKLLVDLANKKLIDTVTSLRAYGTVCKYEEPSISSVQVDNPYHELLYRFPGITKPFNYKEKPTHSVFHHIETTGPPDLAKARPLPPKVQKGKRRI